MPATSASVVLHPVVQFPLKELKTHPENKFKCKLEIINNCDQQSNETLPHSLSSSSCTSCSSSGSHRSYTCLKSTSEESLLSSGMNSSSSTASYFSLLSFSPDSPPHSPCNRPSTPTVPPKLANLQLRLWKRKLASLSFTSAAQTASRTLMTKRFGTPKTCIRRPDGVWIARFHDRHKVQHCGLLQLAA